MKKFEYKHKTLSNELTSDLNKLGNEGWELIFIYKNRYYFKREII